MAFTPDFLNQVEQDRQQVATLTQSFYRDTKLAWRVKSILNYNPYMSNNIDAVMQMAQMPIDDNELFSNVGAMYGMQSADLLSKQLSRYSPSTQRSIFSTLTPAQQQTLRQMGFQPSTTDIDEGNFLEQALSGALTGIGEAASFVFSGIGRKVMPVLSPALNLLDETSDFIVGRPYRTIRQLGWEDQLAAGLGAVLGAAGAFLVPVTGGLSLTLTGLGAVIGGSAAAFGSEAFVGNADDWFEAWNKAGNGERLFTNSGVNEAVEILGDPKLVNMAKKIALSLDDDTSLIELAQDFAGTERSTNPDVQQNQIAKIAAEFVEPTSPLYQNVYAGLQELVNDPLFREAVKVLEQSKISIGRDVARTLGLDPDSDAYRLISGSVDAATLLILDPFLVAGKTARVINMSRKGIYNVDAVKAAERFRVLAEHPAINRKYQIFVDAINTGSTALAKRFANDLMPVWNEFLTYTKLPEFANRPITTSDFVDWVIGPNQMRSIMQGVGMVQGVSYGMLRGVNKFQYAMKSKVGAVSDFMAGASDVGLEEIIKKISGNPNVLNSLLQDLPAERLMQIASVTEDAYPEFAVWLAKTGAPDTLAKLVKASTGADSIAYEMGRKYSRLPFVKAMGSLYTNMSTLSPRGSIIMLDSTRTESISDINAFIDLFQTVGVPSYVREVWKQAIWQSPEIGTRIDLLTSLVDSAATATGMRSTRFGSDFIDDFVNHVRSEYGLGANGRYDLITEGGRTIKDIPVGIKPDADGAIMMQIPDLQTMRKAVRQGTLLRVLVGIPESVPLEAFQSKLWKPAVLLRFGFFVRNVSEDLLALVARAGIGHFNQEFAARSIGQQNVYEIAKAKVTPGEVLTGSIYGVPLDKPLKGRSDAWLLPGEQLALNRNYLYPAHVRPVVRIIERFGREGSPTLTLLEDYGKWLRNHLETGFKLPRLNPELPLRDLMNKSRALQSKAAETIDKTGLINRARTNFYLNTDLLAYGSQYSTRRLLFGGADPSLIRAAESFTARHIGAVMQRVGATNALPWGQDDGSENLIQRSFQNAKGEKETMWVRVTGERTHIAPGTKDVSTDDFHEAVHKAVVRLTDDSLQSRVLFDVSRVYNEEIAELIYPNTLYNLLISWGETGRKTVGEGLPEVLHLGLIILEKPTDAQRFRAFVENSLGLGGIRRADDGSTTVVDYFRINLLDSFQGQAVPNGNDFAKLIRDTRKEAKKAVKDLEKQIGLFDEIRVSGKLSDEQWDQYQELVEKIKEARLVEDDLNKALSYANFFDQVETALARITDPAAQQTARRWLVQNFALDGARRGGHFTGGSTDPEDYFKMLNNWYVSGEGTAPGFGLAQDGLFNGTLLVRDFQGPFVSGPFYRNLDEALRAGKEGLIDEINQGSYEGIIQQSRLALPGAPGTKFYMIQPLKATQGLITVDMLKDVRLLNFDETPNIDFLIGWLDIGGAITNTQKGVLVGFLSDFADSLLSGKPFIVSSEEVANALNSITNNLYQRFFNMASSKPKPTWLPIVQDEITSTYPELASRTKTFWIDNGPDGTLTPVSSIAWDPNIYPTPDVFMEEVRKFTYPVDLVERLIVDIEQNIRGGRRMRHVVRENSEVYIRINGKPEPLGPGVFVDQHTELFADADLSQRINVNNPKYFRTEDITYAGNNEIMWNILAPTLIDLSEELAQHPVRAVKSWQTVRVDPNVSAEAALSKKGYALPKDVIRVRSASVKDVIDTPAEMLPDFALGQIYEPVVQGKWERVVQFGFDRVLSPMIDAVARRPMAFHSYVNAYQRNVSSVQWLFRNTDEERAVNDISRRVFDVEAFTVLSSGQIDRFEDAGRTIARIHGIQDSDFWSAEQALAYLRSVSPQEIAGLDKAAEIARAKGLIGKTPSETKALIGFVRENSLELELLTLDSELNAWRFIDRIDSVFGDGTALSGGFIPNKELWKKVQRSRDRYAQVEFEIQQIDENVRMGFISADDGAQQLARINNETETMVELDKVFRLDSQIMRFDRTLTKDDWKDIQRAAKLRNNTYEQATDYASEYAIRDIMPYIDTHEIRSQFADWARGYLPFWYAEENFLKRWAKIMTLEGPAGSLARARKLQLTAQGLKTMGIVRQDPNGNSYFVYPGSDLLVEAISQIPGIGLLPVQALLQTPVERMIPGFSPQFGAPGLSPLLALPVEIATMLFPESPAVNRLQRNIFGDISVNQDLFDLIVPAQIRNTFEAIFEFTKPFESTGSERMQSAMVSAMAHLEAENRGLPDNATPSEIDEYLRMVRKHARVIVLSQALAGWFTPGPAQVLQVPEGQDSLSWLTNGQINNPAEVLSATYYEMIKNLGIEEGTQAYLARFPENSIQDILNPMAYTVSKTETPSGAPLPMSEDGINFYENNRSVFEQYTLAGPWLLPQDRVQQGERSQYAYDAAMIDGLRIRKSPEEFIRELKFREGAAPYFSARKKYLDEYARLKEQKQSVAMRQLRSDWDMFAQYWKTTHTVFADVLVSSESRERRTNVIDEMRYLLNDPLAPQASHFGAMKTLMDSFDTFMLERSRLALNKTTFARSQVESLKAEFDAWISKFVTDNPAVNSFWLTVLRPESGLD